MLVLHYITATSWQEERSVKVTVCQQHSLASCEHRQAPDELYAHKAKRPYKQRHAVEGHPLSSHVCYGNQEVYTSQNTSNTRNVQTKDCLVHRSSGVRKCTAKRRIS